jgi:hypothetical protein
LAIVIGVVDISFDTAFYAYLAPGKNYNTIPAPTLLVVLYLKILKKINELMQM